MPLVDPLQLPTSERLPGWIGRTFHSENMPFVYYDIAAGSSLHAHHHANEEVWHIVEGELEMTLGGAITVVRAGQAAVIPPELEHAAHTATGCRAIVVDYPIREGF